MALPHPIPALLRDDYASIDPRMPEYLGILTEQGAPEIWHKHGTFKDHLLGVWRILAAWKQPEHVCRLGLFHSVYSNSFVRMALFHADRDADRRRVRDLIGDEAERLVHAFCVIDRQALLFAHVLAPDPIPAGGLTLKDFRTGVPVPLSRADVAAFIAVTMADYAEQFFGWQDRMFGNGPGLGGDNSRSLWPGDGRPGLWMNLASRMAAALRACGHEPLPPVFDGCTALLDAGAEREARDRYWRVVYELTDEPDAPEATRLLEEACALNRFAAEPHALLAQLHIHRERFAEAEAHAATAIALLAAWSTPSDKRLPWAAWMAWSRVLWKAARERTWPDTAMGVISLGEVRLEEELAAEAAPA